MKNFKEIDGDLIELFKQGEFDVIAHGCNCYATMGAGIALTIGQEFPEAMLADVDCKIPNGIKRLGKLTYTEVDELFEVGKERPKYLFNLYTQFMPGPDFRMSAFKKSLKEMKNVINYECYSSSSIPTEEVRIGLPLIGCGIAGGDWNEVKKVIQKELSEFDVTIVHFKQKVEGVNWWPKRQKNVSKQLEMFDEKDTWELTENKVDDEFSDEEVIQYFKDNHDVDISTMTEKELDEFLESI